MHPAAPDPGNKIRSAEPDTAPSLFFGPQGLRPFWCLLLYLAIVSTPIFLFILAGRLAKSTGVPVQVGAPAVLYPVQAFSMELFQLGLVLFATWIMSRIESRSLTDYGLQWTPLSVRRLLTGAIWGLLFMSLLIAILFGTHHLVFAGAALRPLSALAYGAFWTVNFLLVALFEESLFRGYLQSVATRCVAGLVRKVMPRLRHPDAAGFWIAAVLISFGFGAVHQSNPGESPVGLLCAGLAGLMFAFTLWRTGSLWWAIGLHAAWDWAQSYLFGVADSGTVSAGHLLSTHPTGSALLSGGSTGPEGSLFVLPVMLLIVIVIAVTLRPNGEAVDHAWTTPQPLPSAIAE